MGVAFTSIEPDCRLKCRSPRTRMKSQLGVVAGREHGVPAMERERQRKRKRQQPGIRRANTAEAPSAAQQRPALTLQLPRCLFWPPSSSSS